LTKETAQLSIEKLDTRFDVKTNDEVGVLNSALNLMVTRLRASLIKLSVAEKKAAFAEIARQVNHDIKNGFIPIRNIMQHLSEVARGSPDQLVRIFRERESSVVASVDYLENLARNYSRLKSAVKPAMINVNHTLSGLADYYRQMAAGRINFETVLADREPQVYADEVQFRRVLENIIQNAIDAIEGSGVIRLTSAIAVDEIVITCEDNGSGIADAVQQRLFQPHFTTKAQGSGLGLANVKRIIEDFNGKVALTSQQGRGTTVTIRMPLVTKGVDEK
jgi:signal transduction histidine kinase